MCVSHGYEKRLKMIRRKLFRPITGPKLAFKHILVHLFKVKAEFAFTFLSAIKVEKLIKRESVLFYGLSDT